MTSSHLDEWNVEDPEKEDMYLVAFVGYVGEERWPSQNHYYALAMWLGDYWVRQDFPQMFEHIHVLAWQPLPDFFQGE